MRRPNPYNEYEAKYAEGSLHFIELKLSNEKQLGTSEIKLELLNNILIKRSLCTFRHYKSELKILFFKYS